MINLNQFKDEYLLGLIDGLNGSNTTVLTLILFPIATLPNLISRMVTIQVVTRAVTSSISMGGAIDNSTSERNSFLCGLSTGLGYFTSAVVPIIGFFFNETTGIVVFIPMVILMLFIITKLDVRKIGFKKNIIRTLFLYILAVGSGVLVTFLFK